MAVFINTEIFSREFEPNLLLSVVSVNRGMPVFIFDQRQLPGLANRAIRGPGVLHTKSVPTNSALRRSFRRARSSGLQITSIDQEGGLIEPNYARFLEERFPPDTFDYVDAVFSWGEWDHTALVSRFPANSSQIVEGGSSRLDLWKPRFSTAPKPNWIPDGPYVLFSSNLISNGHYRLWQSLGEVIADGQISLDDDGTREFFDNFSHSVIMHREFLLLFDRLSSKFPDITFVIRPHPTEDEAAWRSLLPHRKNILVSRKGGISPWIHECQALIHHGCTSGLEATVAGKPVIYFEPDSLRSSAANQSRRLGNLARTAEEVEELLSIVTGRNGTPGGYTAAESQFLSKFGKSLRLDWSASEKVVNYWSQHLSRPSWFGTFKRALFMSATSNLLYLKHSLIRRFRKDRGRYTLEKFPNLVLKDSRSIIRYLCSSFGLEEPAIVKLSPRCIVVFPRLKIENLLRPEGQTEVISKNG